MQNRYTILLLAGALAFAFGNAPAFGQVSHLPDPEAEAGFVGSVLTCSQQPQPTSMLRVPRPLYERAKVKARLAALLRDSLYDDAKGIVNMAREKEIRKLASKLKSGEF